MPRFPYLSTIFLLLSALIATVIVPNTVQILPQVKQIEADLSARFGGEVKIDGPVRLRFVPRPQLIVEKSVLATIGALKHALLQQYPVSSLI